MKKVLFVATVDSHIRHFHIPYLKLFHDKGFEVHVATADDEGEKFDYCDKKHKITFERSPFKLNNLKAVNQMVSLIKEEKFDVIHCHTPMGSVVTRLAVRKLRRNCKHNDDVQRANKETISSGAQCAPQEDSTLWSPNTMQVIYTAHGFHFFKGAPLKNWLIYYPIEKWLSKYTDKLITINKEDYEYAKKFKAKKVYMIDGIGVDGNKFNVQLSNDEKKKLKKELSSISTSFKILDDDIVITYVAELIHRKHQDFLIKAVSDILKKEDNQEIYSKIKVLIVGTGVLKEKYQKLIDDLGLSNHIVLTGYRKDVPRIFNITDLCVSTSRQEGLGLNLIEGALCNVPLLASNVRGHNEILDDGNNGFLYEPDNYTDFEKKLCKLVKDNKLRIRMSKKAKQSVHRFLLSNSVKEMKKIYEE